MSQDNDISRDVEDLRSRFSETRALYQEVCALLFFRYGITPTASRLYQYVRKGSMGVPAEELAKFWEGLRARARVELDHPGLPTSLQKNAGELLTALWQEAVQSSREELSSLRDEASAQVVEMRERAAEMERSRASLRLELDAALATNDRLAAQVAERAAALEKERREHGAARATNAALQKQIEQLRLEQGASRAQFSDELEKARSAARLAVQRAEEAERRALRDMDQERTARAALAKQLEAVRASLTQEERTRQVQALEATAAQVRLAAALETANAAAASASEQNASYQAKLEQALETGARHKAEADALRSLVRQARPAPRPLRKNRSAASGPTG